MGWGFFGFHYSVNWVNILWPMIAAACLTLAAMHVLVWLQDRKSWASLIFSALAVCVAAIALFELAMMRAETPAQFGNLGRWIHVPVFFGMVSIVLWVRVYFGTGRPWLGWTLCGLRLASLVINFLCAVNINYAGIVRLRQLRFLGGTVSAAQGTANPWSRLPEFTVLLLVIFVADASVKLWRLGGSEERRRALVIGGSLTLFLLVAGGIVILLQERVLVLPYLVSVPFLFMVAAMSYELSRDVLRAAQLARDLRESHQRLDLAASAADLGQWVWDLARDKIWATAKGLELFGFPPSESLNFDRFLNSLHPEDREAVRQAVARSMKGDGEYDSEYRIVLRDGRMRWIVARGRVEFNSGGKPIRMRGVSIDITERKRAEEKFRLAAEASPSGIIMVDQRGRILLVNALTEKLFGYSRDELVGQSMEILVPERFREVHTGLRAGFFADPKARAMGVGRELFARRKDASEFPLEIGLNPIQTDEGVLVLAAIVDLTERCRAEQELARHRQELAHVSRVAILGELSASMAHELNQPLTAILSNAQAAQRFMAAGQPDLKEFREILLDIAHDTTRARDVIRQLRALVKREAPDFNRLDLNETIRDVAGFLHGDIVARNVSINLDLSPDIPPVWGGRIQLQQVMINLLLNAFDAMSAQPVAQRRVDVLTRRESSGGVCVAVRDHGPGIAPDKLDVIFDPFYTTKAQGMGMGLSISRSIIEEHRGRLTAENNPEGGGATFSFALPAFAADIDH